jgi:hypothetical protein
LNRYGVLKIKNDPFFAFATLLFASLTIHKLLSEEATLK